jgi:hypothetical protein
MAKLIFSTTGSVFIFDGTSYYLTNMTLSETKNKINVTDTGTSGDGTEYVYGRTDRTFTVDIMKPSGSVDFTLGVPKSCIIKFEGHQYVGSASLDSKSIEGSIDNAVKVKYAGTFQGAITN